MQKAIEEISLELGKAIKQLETTFEWKLNWFYYRKVEILGKILEELLELSEKEKNLEAGKQRKEKENRERELDDLPF